MKKSIFFKIFSGYFLITLLLSGLILYLSFTTIRSHYLNLLREELTDLGASVGMQVAPLIEAKRLPELESLVRQLDRETHKRITVIDPSGVVLADSENDPSSMENHRARPEISRALQGEAGNSIRFSATMKEEMLYVAFPLGERARPRGVVRVSMPLKNINTLLASVKTHILNSTLIIIALSLCASFLFARSLSLPIRKLGLAARKVASGDFSTQVHLENRDELRELAESFNFMTEHIRKLFAEVSDRRRELDTIVSSIQEALFVFDREGKITLGNRSFGTVIGHDAFAGRFYWELLRAPQFEELAKSVRETRQNVSGGIEFQGNSYLCSISLLPGREDRIVLLHDITQLKNLEKFKKDFVANVSHELRTPLTAIKGFVETLEDDAKGDAKRYLSIIAQHTERLINIVQDLLLLSSLEEKGYSLETGPVDLKSVIADMARIFEPKVRERGLRLKLDLPEALPPVAGDAFKLGQVFINLIDNAVKYTETGDISVSLRQDDRSAVIEVRDTGIGIPPEHLDRIFERFYVVDKSRSRKAGGTGLGLSIVKHIVLLHGGTITVDSTAGKGTVFTVTLPVKTA